MAAAVELAHRRVRRTQQPHAADHSTHDATQDVTAAFIARNHLVTDEHHGGAGVVGDHSEPHVVVGVGAIAPSRQLGGAVDDRAHGVDLVDVVDPLQQRRHSLKAHAGVDVLGRQFTDDVEVVLAANLSQARTA